MLTIKSNFSIFKDKQDKLITVDELQSLSKNIITSDIVNFRGRISYGYTTAVAEEIIKKITVKKNEQILVINDLTLEMYNALTDAGYNNIILAYGKWNKDATPANEDITYTIMKLFIETNFKEKINVIKLKEIFNMKYKVSAVIANPPYGSIGAKIVNHIRLNVLFDEYINLEPVVDYLKVPKLINYLDLTSIDLVEGFEGAHVLPSLCKISNTEVNKLTKDEFYLFTVSNNVTDKYIKANSKSSYIIEMSEDTTDTSLDFDNKLIFGVKICSNSTNHADKLGINLTGSINTTPYKINNKLLTLKQYYEVKKSKAFWGVILTFKTAQERENAFNFAYSDEGSRFLNLLAYSFKRDNYHIQEYSILFPRVDWNYSWNLKKILSSYGYTENEIEDVILKLSDFRGAGV